MKEKCRIFGFLAILVSLALVFAACNNGSSGGNGGGSGNLTITITGIPTTGNSGITGEVVIGLVRPDYNGGYEGIISAPSQEDTVTIQNGIATVNFNINYFKYIGVYGGPENGGEDFTNDTPVVINIERKNKIGHYGYNEFLGKTQYKVTDGKITEDFSDFLRFDDWINYRFN
jgi:hypothetical protein